MREKMSAEDFIGKIHSEGGILDALDYGLTERDYDLPISVAGAWKACRIKFTELIDLIDDFGATVEENGLDLDWI